MKTITIPFQGENYGKAVRCYKEAVLIAPYAQDVDKVKQKLSAAQAKFENKHRC